MESFYEIETTCKRAARASGFSWGIAEEIGKIVRSLEIMGLPGLKTFYRYLDDVKNGILSKPTKILFKNVDNNKSYCPIESSVAVLDDCKNLFKNNDVIEFDQMAHPLLLIPMLNRASNIIGKKICISFDDIEIILNYNESLVVNTKEPFPNQTNKVSIQSMSAEPTYSKEEYDNLYQLSLETFVEESEGKLSGAGAGLTDND
jgi:hypothetical protein